MKNPFLIFLILFVNCFSIAQKQNSFEFQPLNVIDTITQKIVDKIKSKDKIKNTQYFFAQTYGNEKGLFLFKKVDKEWIVYDYDEYFISNYTITKHKFYSRQFVAIGISAIRSGMGENYYSWLVIFDLKNSSFVILNTFSYNSGKYDNNTEFKDECKSDIQYLKNGNLKVVKVCKVKKEDKNYCDNCLDSGIYKFENGIMKKIKSSH